MATEQALNGNGVGETNGFVEQTVESELSVDAKRMLGHARRIKARVAAMEQSILAGQMRTPDQFQAAVYPIFDEVHGMQATTSSSRFTGILKGNGSS